MAKFFTLEQAERLLPEVGAAIRDAISRKSEFEQAESEVQRTSHWIMMSGGASVDRDQVLDTKNRRDAGAGQLKEAIEKIHSFGCLVKDLDIGLIDFPTRLRGQEVYLCWKLGESGIGFWHGVEEGFRGRKKIDQDFLDNHQGDLPN